jgi:hypothetical protein
MEEKYSSATKISTPENTKEVPSGSEWIDVFWLPAETLSLKRLREDRKASQKTTFATSFKASIVVTSVVSEIWGESF